VNTENREQEKIKRKKEKGKRKKEKTELESFRALERRCAEVRSQKSVISIMVVDEREAGYRRNGEWRCKK